MPGRPKMMAKKITELEAKAEEVFNLITEYIPKQYEMHEGPLEEMDELCRGWNESMFAIIDASCRVGELAKMLRAKAGIDEVAFREARRASVVTRKRGILPSRDRKGVAASRTVRYPRRPLPYGRGSEWLRNPDELH